MNTVLYWKTKSVLELIENIRHGYVKIGQRNKEKHWWNYMKMWSVKCVICAANKVTKDAVKGEKSFVERGIVKGWYSH